MLCCVLLCTCCNNQFPIIILNVAYQPVRVDMRYTQQPVRVVVCCCISLSRPSPVRGWAVNSIAQPFGLCSFNINIATTQPSVVFLEISQATQHLFLLHFHMGFTSTHHIAHHTLLALDHYRITICIT